MSEGAANGAKENGQADPGARLEAMQKELDSVRAQLEAERAAGRERLELAKRIQADFDNFKKRMQREKEESAKASNDRLMLDLLVTVDDLERALSPSVKDEELRKGVQQIHSNLMALLRSYGLREIPAEGRFDPALHEAFAACDGEEGVIYETYQKGYLIGNRVIRHAKVKVGRASQEGEQNG
jgi:molecular chaperone GrpE